MQNKLMLLKYIIIWTLVFFACGAVEIYFVSNGFMTVEYTQWYKNLITNWYFICGISIATGIYCGFQHYDFIKRNELQKQKFEEFKQKIYQTKEGDSHDA